MRRLHLPFLALLLLTGCAAVPKDPLPTARNVDLQRFMGDWYVIAAIPTAIEKEAYNAIERYDLAPDGTIATTFTFRKGAFDGPAKKYTPTGFVRDREHNSTWGMRFVWPFKAEFLISYLDAQYTQTIIARNARDYVWIMARTPEIPAADYERLVAQVAAWGYDTSELRKVPQQWPAAAPTGASAAAPAVGAGASAPATSAAAPAQPTTYAFAHTVMPEGLAEAQAAKRAPLVIDVSTAAEFAEGHVPGAINVPHDQIEARLSEITAKPDDEVVLYCRSGRRAGLAAEVLQRHGFTNVAHLMGDMPAWIAVGYPVAKP